MAKFIITIEDHDGGVKIESNPPAGPLLKAIHGGIYLPTKAESIAASFFVDCIKAGMEKRGTLHQGKKKPSGLIY